jgi:hypothetical protein
MVADGIISPRISGLCRPLSKDPTNLEAKKMEIKDKRSGAKDGIFHRSGSNALSHRAFLSWNGFGVTSRRITFQ